MPVSSSDTQAEVNPGQEQHTLLNVLLGIAIMVVLFCAYHLVIVSPKLAKLESSGQQYYILDLEALSEAKIVSLMRIRDLTGKEPSEAEVNAEMVQFRDNIKNQLMGITGGAPVFQTGSVLNYHDGVLDLTSVIAEQNGITIGDSFARYTKEHEQKNE